MAQEENLKLQQAREEFEATNNTIELHLHLAPLYKLENGALQPVCKEQPSTTTLSFDRRKTVGDLRLTIYQGILFCSKDARPLGGDMALTVAKSLPAGLHLYNTLTDDCVSLYSAGITNNTDLFVWNGKEVCGAAVLTGAEWEPVLLTVVRPFLGPDVENDTEDPGNEDVDSSENQAPGLRKEARGFAGGATLGEVRAALGEPKESLLCQEHKARRRVEPEAGEGGGASGWRVFPPDDMQRTLKELSLKDGDALLVLEPQSFDSSVFTLNGDVVTVTTPSDCRWLQVEHQPHIRLGQREEEPHKVKVMATGNTLLMEVKQRALEKIQELEQKTLEGAEYCLRQVDCTGKLLPPGTMFVPHTSPLSLPLSLSLLGTSPASCDPPLCEELSVREAGVRLMTTLTLCLGRAPEASQVRSGSLCETALYSQLRQSRARRVQVVQFNNILNMEEKA
ncbi:hypothetical protein WMY93_016808 [Mugilogobius chulae]|uniref:Uncharacterized protein n=1 Tax=Mugilogobius chulae TaxID=88201 RepID=A0AAW0NLU0_9GOBI